MQSSSSQWPPDLTFDSIDPDLTFDDLFDVPDFDPSPNEHTLSPKASCNGPKGSPGKPIRRRSRASKKAPATLLKANTNNFRSLVQQFTGCHSATPAFGLYKGPINLNFEQCTYYPKYKEVAEVKQKQLVVQNKQDSYNSIMNSAADLNIVDDDKDDELLFGSRDDQNPRAEALTYDGYDMEEIWGQEMSGSGDYSTGTTGDGFWGY